MIVVLDYGLGNLGSILNMLRKIGADAVVSPDPEVIRTATAIILPGVGAFDEGMSALRNRGFDVLLKDRVTAGVHVLGICLGMQLLFESSEEGQQAGLGLLSGMVKRFDPEKITSNGQKIPHMGWNDIEVVRESLLYRSLENDSRFYFVHSFHAVVEHDEDVLATCDYGYSFPCSVNRGNIYGAQFHPEKSHRFGMQFFRNFVEVVSSAS